MLPKLELHRGSSMEFSSGHHGRNQEEVEEGLEDEVERHKEEENTQEQVRMSMTMDGNDADANET